MLSYAEEIFLLALDDVTGEVVINQKEITLKTVLVSAAICDLFFLKKIDHDDEKIYLLDKSSTGNPVLDEVLRLIEKNMCDKEISITLIMEELIDFSDSFEAMILQELLDKKILKKVEEKIFWIIPNRRYPVINNKEITEVETRVIEIITTDTEPELRDAVLIGLIDACGLMKEILSPRQLNRHKDRIREIGQRDAVVQKTGKVISQLLQFSHMPPYL